jgi:hypothetical protein
MIITVELPEAACLFSLQASPGLALADAVRSAITFGVATGSVPGFRTCQFIPTAARDAVAYSGGAQTC